MAEPPDLDATIRSFGVPLTAADLATIRRFHSVVTQRGLALHFNSHGRPPQLHYPTLRDLILATDRAGRSWHYLASEADYQFVQGDVADAATVSATIKAFRPNVVMHLAAESHVDRSIDGPGAFIDTNVGGTFTLLEAALAYWRKLEPDARVRLHVDELYRREHGREPR